MGRVWEVFILEKKKMPLAAKICIGIVAVLVIGGLGAWMFINGKLNLINRIIDTGRINASEETFEAGENNGGEVIDEKDVDLNEDDVKTFTAADVKNILLIGNDGRTATEKGTRSDTMMICSINTKTKEIKLTSLLRDTYVAIPGFSKNRLNAAHAFGGVSLLDETIEKNFGIHIDGNFAVNFESFVEALTQVGEVELELSQTEANAVNREGGFHVKAGKVSLKPEEALMYVRIRHTGGGDWERTERQRKFIIAAFNKVKSLSLSDMMSLANKVLPCLATDLSNGTILSYITEVGTGGYKLGETLRIPVDGAWKYAMINEYMAVVLPDLQKNASALQEFIYGTDLAQN